MRADASVSVSGAFHQEADIFHRWDNLSITKVGESTQCHLSISPLLQIRSEGERTDNTYMGILPLCNTEDVEELIIGEQ